MTALPASSDFTGSTRTQGQAKTAWADQRAFLAGLLGTDGLPATARTALGLVPTASATDTTAGRLLKVADFGLGTLAVPGVPPLDATPAPTGFVNSTTDFLTASGLPVQCAGITLRWSLNRSAQLFGSVAASHAGRWFGRHQTADNTWGTIYEFLMLQRILGTVSQSGGVPTGRVFESGSNANGRYERRANGSLECWQTMAADSGAAATWTFPSAFNEAPRVVGTAEATVLSTVCLDTAPGTTSVTFSARDKTDARRADNVHLHAIGRWSSMT